MKPLTILLAVGALQLPAVRGVKTEPVHTLEGHEKAVLAVAFSRDGTRLATGSESGLVRIWDPKSGELVVDLEFGYAVNGMSFTKDGKTLVSGTWGAQIWDAVEGTRKNHIEAHTGFLTCVATSPDGKAIATGGLDSTVKIWDPNNWIELRTLTHRDQVNGISFSGNGKLLAIGGDTSVGIWNTSDWKLKREIKSLPANDIALDAEGKHLYVGSSEGDIKVLDPADGRELRRSKAGSAKVTAISLSANGKHLVVASEDQSARFFTADDLKETAVWMHPDVVTCVAFAPDGKSVATGCKDKNGRIWKVP